MILGIYGIHNNNNNNTNIYKAHIVSIRAESEAPAVAIGGLERVVSGCCLVK